MNVRRAVFILLFLFVSCGEDKPGNTFFTATFNGSTYNATKAHLYMNGYGVFIEASDDDDNSFAMTFFQPMEVPSTLKLGLGTSDPIGGILIISKNDLFVYEKGTVIITLITESHMEGNFDVMVKSIINKHSTKIKGSFSLNSPEPKKR